MRRSCSKRPAQGLCDAVQQVQAGVLRGRSPNPRRGAHSTPANRGQRLSTHDGQNAGVVAQAAELHTRGRLAIPHQQLDIRSCPTPAAQKLLGASYLHCDG